MLIYCITQTMKKFTSIDQMASFRIYWLASVLHQALSPAFHTVCVETLGCEGLGMRLALIMVMLS